MLIAPGIVVYNPARADMPGNVACVPDLPAISSRWTPKQVLRRDTAAGTFEHVNPREFSNDALYLQQALIYDARPAQPRQVSLAGAFLLGCCVAVATLIAWWASA
jgi:hypothetical protein